jgi:predicted permease
MISRLAGDVRWAIRFVVRRPVYAAAMIGTLTLGISATTVAWGFGASILWRPLPFDGPDRLVFVWESSSEGGVTAPFRVTSGRFAEWRKASRSFQSLALFGAAGFSLETADGIVPVRGVRVSPTFFDVLGVRPQLGRTFTPDDEMPGRGHVVVISHRFWRQRFGGRPTIVGSSLRFNGLPYTVVGVMPPLAFPGWPVNPATVTIDAATREFWVPIVRTPQLDTNTRSHVYGVLGRLAAGTSIVQATDELTRMASGSAADPHGGVATAFREQFVRDARLPILALIGAAAALLLVSSANLAALQVSAFESRKSELSIRAAVGASAGRLATQLSAESLVLAVAAGGAALAVSRLALATLPDRLPPGVPLLTPAALDLRVALVAVGASVAAALITAGWPVLRLLRSGPAPRGVAAHTQARVFRSLVVAQVSVTIALVATAALLVRSLWTIEAVNPGFQISHVAVAELGLPPATGTPAKIVEFEDRLQQSFASRPGILGVALAYDHPLEANWTDAFTLDGVSSPDAEVRDQAQLRIVSPSYFDALRVELLGGRLFGVEDDLARPGVAVVNEAFVLANGPAVLGRRLRTAAPQMTWGQAAAGDFEIVGVVGDERFRGLERASEPAVYLSTRQFPQTGVTLLLRTAADPRAILRDIRAGVRSIDPATTVGTPTSLADILAEQLVARRVTADVIGGLAAAALALAGLGIYGVLTVLLASRSREIGIRLALGATPGRIARHVLAMSVGNAMPGIVIGIGLAVLAGRLLEDFLVGVTSTDLSTLMAVAAIMFGFALLAGLVPAIRAARVNPIGTLRG